MFKRGNRFVVYLQIWCQLLCIVRLVRGSPWTSKKKIMDPGVVAIFHLTEGVERRVCYKTGLVTV